MSEYGLCNLHASDTVGIVVVVIEDDQGRSIMIIGHGMRRCWWRRNHIDWIDQLRILNRLGLSHMMHFVEICRLAQPLGGCC